MQQKEKSYFLDDALDAVDCRRKAFGESKTQPFLMQIKK
jgi:hypothetical protein